MHLCSNVQAYTFHYNSLFMRFILLKYENPDFHERLLCVAISTG